MELFIGEIIMMTRRKGMEFFSFLMESINQGKLKQNDIEEYGTYLT